jgi:choline dehydrogenase-like flavoprotein
MTIAREELSRDHDAIVCGAGSSGSVVAARLSAHPDVRVLLLEAGPTDDAATVDDPSRTVSRRARWSESIIAYTSASARRLGTGALEPWSNLSVFDYSQADVG